MEGAGTSCPNSAAQTRVTGSSFIQLILVDARFLNPVPMRKAILHLKKADPVLRTLIDRVGAYRMEYRHPGFETLVRSIVYQQLSGKVARVIFDRLAAAVPGGELTPEGILKLTPSRMRKAGLSKQKTAYIRDLARKTKRGILDFSALPDLADEQVIEMLTQVKGIGVWDRAHVFDVRTGAAECPADGRFGNSHGDPAGIRDGRIAECEADRRARGRLASLLYSCQLVSLAKSGLTKYDRPSFFVACRLAFSPSESPAPHCSPERPSLPRPDAFQTRIDISRESVFDSVRIRLPAA